MNVVKEFFGGSKKEKISVGGQVYKIPDEGQTLAHTAKTAKGYYYTEAGETKWFAVKRTPHPTVQAQQEVRILQDLQHDPNIIEYVASETTVATNDAGQPIPTTYLVTQLYGDPSTVYCRNKKNAGFYTPAMSFEIDEAEIVRVCQIMVNICRAVCTLHGSSPPVAHRNICLESIFLGSGGMPNEKGYDKTEEVVWRLGGFGSATTEAMQCRSALQVEQAYNEVHRSTQAEYRAPEMLDLRRSRIDQQVDIWALGVVFYRLLFLEAPFNGDAQNVVQNRFSLPSPARGTKIDEILHQMLAKEPSHRPDIWTLTNFFSDYLSELQHLEKSEPRCRPSNWTEQTLVDWCNVAPSSISIAPTPKGDSPKARKLEHDILSALEDESSGPMVAPSTPTGASAGIVVSHDGVEEISRPYVVTPQSGFDMEASVENPVVDDYDEVPRVHLVSEETFAERRASTPHLSLSRKGEGKVPRTVSAKFKDWVEKKGVSGKTLKLFHSDTPHAWVIRSTDVNFKSLKTLYLSKLVVHIKDVQKGTVHGDDAPLELQEAVRNVLYYLRLRPVSYNSLVAYKTLFVTHYIMQECDVEVQRVVHAFRRQLFEEIAHKWAGLDALKEDEAQKHLPLLHVVVVAYASYLQKRVEYFVKTNSLCAHSDEDAALLSDLFIRGVELVEDIKPPLVGKKVFHSSLLVKMVLDLEEIYKGLAPAPKTGRRWQQVEEGVAVARSRFEELSTLISEHMPELQLSPHSGAAISPAVSPRCTNLRLPSVPQHEGQTGMVRSASSPAQTVGEFENTYQPSVAASAAGPPEDSFAISAHSSPGVPAVMRDAQNVFDVEELYYMFEVRRCGDISVQCLSLRGGNESCCDCSAPVTSVNCNIGVFLCTGCAALHDTLGLGHSKPIEASFNPHEIDQLHRIGNDNARAVWLGALLSDTPSHKLVEDRKMLPHLNPEARPDEFHEFMVNKYILRKYIGRLLTAEQSIRGMTWFTGEDEEEGECGMGARQATVPVTEGASDNLIFFSPEKEEKVEKESSKELLVEDPLISVCLF